MTAEIMEENILTFFLDFKNEGGIGKIQVTEPVKWDGSTATVEQDDERYGRDVRFGNKEVSLFFYKGLFEPATSPLQLPNGAIVCNLTMGFEFLLDAYQSHYFEAKITQSINKNGVEFITGELLIMKTDLLTYFECKIRETTPIAEIKRNDDTEIDILSNLDIYENQITPVATSRILLKAKPWTKVSSWSAIEEVVQFAKGFLGAPSFFNRIKSQTKSDIGNSITWGEDYTEAPFPTTNYPTPPAFFRILKAAFSLTNLTAEFQLNMTTEWVPGDTDGNFEVIGRFVKFKEGEFFDVFEAGDSPNNIKFYDTDGLGPSSGNYIYNYNGTMKINFPNMEIDEVLGFLFYHRGSDAIQLSKNTFHPSELTITATETAVDSVITGVRYIDAVKQVTKSINGMPVFAQRFELGGDFENEFVFDGYRIRQFLDKPFNLTFKKIIEGKLPKDNADYQIKPEVIYIGIEDDFYPNNDLGGFMSAPNTEFSSYCNERFTTQKIEVNFKNHEKDENEENTLDIVHAESQWLTPNRNVENTKVIDIDVIIDPYMIESSRRQGVSEKPTTSIDSDDKIFLIRCVEVAPGTTLTNNFSLLHSTEEAGVLQVMNTGVFNWTLLGFNIGATLIFNSGENTGSYAVTEYNQTVMKLTPIGFTPTYNGITVNNITYPLQNVGYMVRTNENFDLIEGVANPDNFTGLLDTPKRILLGRYGKQLATICRDYPNGKITNRKYNNNGNLTTQFQGGAILKENDPVLVADLPEATLSPEFIDTQFVCSFNQAVNLFEGIQTINSDNTIGGFLRVVNPLGMMVKGFPKKAEYEWSSGIMSAGLEIKNESKEVSITTLGTSLISIQETGYNRVDLGNAWYAINGDFVTLQDANSIPLINPTRWQDISVNGVSFESIDSLADALGNL